MLFWTVFFWSKKDETEASYERLSARVFSISAYIRRLADVHARIHAYAAVAGLCWDGCPVTPVHRATLSWGNAFDGTARGSTPLHFSSRALLSLSPRCMPAGGAAETSTSTTSTTSTTRWCFPGGPSHHRAQGVPLIRSGIPLSLITFSWRVYCWFMTCFSLFHV